MRMRWAAVALVLFLPLRAFALPEFTFSTNEIPLTSSVEITIGIVGSERVNAWSGVWTVDPAEIQIVSIVGIDSSTLTASDAVNFSFSAFSIFGQDTNFDIATVTLAGKGVFDAVAAFTSGSIGEVTSGRTDLLFGPEAMTAPIPEPGTFVLLGLALAGLAGIRRRVA